MAAPNPAESVPAIDLDLAGRNPIRYLWGLVSRRFRRAGGDEQPVPARDVREAALAVADGAEAEARKLAEDLRSGALDLPGWQTGMEALIKRSHAAAGFVGAGGINAATDADREAIEDRIARQFGHLEDFADEIDRGLPLDGRFVNRAGMYGAASVGTYEAAKRVGDLARGDNWERRRTHSKSPCSSCLSYEARGWVPAGELPDVGEECECLSGCKCTFERSASRYRPDDLTMTEPIRPLFDRDRCARRNRLAARQGISTFPVQLSAVAHAEPARLVTARGTLPATEEAAVAQINRVRGLEGTGQELRSGDVWIAYMEAANTRFVSDRHLFLDSSSIRNIAADAESGFAFMNSHRKGGLSSPAELPYGATFAGRYERYVDESGATQSRALLGVYMLRGLKPNGDQGPTTDDFYAGIRGGTLADVSIGFATGTGKMKCDVCGNELDRMTPGGMPLCPHVPGTPLEMTDDQMDAQRARGVADGCASVTLYDARPGEVSAVYNGAVPGAGFRKAISLARTGRLSPVGLRTVRHAFADLAGDSTFARVPPRSSRLPSAPRVPLPLSQRGQPTMPTLNLRDFVDRWEAAGRPETLTTEDVRDLAPDLVAALGQPASFTTTSTAEVSPKPAAAPAPAAPDTESLQEQLRLMQERFEQLEAAREADRKTERLRSIKTESEDFADREIRSGRAIPAERAALVGEYRQAALDDFSHPAEVLYLDPANKPQKGTRVDALKARQSVRPAHSFGRQVVAHNRRDEASEALFDLQVDSGIDPETKILDDLDKAGREYAQRRNRGGKARAGTNGTG